MSVEFDSEDDTTERIRSLDELPLWRGHVWYDSTTFGGGVIRSEKRGFSNKST